MSPVYRIQTPGFVPLLLPNTAVKYWDIPFPWKGIVICYDTVICIDIKINSVGKDLWDHQVQPLTTTLKGQLSHGTKYSLVFL